MASSRMSAPIRSILVPVDGSEASQQAIALACTIAKRNKGKVVAVHVIEVRRSLPLDAELTGEAEQGERYLAIAERIGDELDQAVEGELLQAREAAHAIVDEAIERQVDAIVVGVDYSAPFGQFQLGRVTQYVLKNAPCHVILWRHPAEES